MNNVFKKTKYIDGYPIAPEDLRVSSIRVSDYWLYYLQLLHEDLGIEYCNEWILKQYIIYYLRAPEITFPILANIFEKKIDSINLAQMILHLDRIHISPFELI